MAMGNNGGLFIGALKPEDKRFLKPLLRNALKAGYTRFVEPCAGAMAMSYLAAEAGWKPEQIEASDISYFSGVMGRAIMDESTADMHISAKGFTAKELEDPATALYAQLYLRTAQTAGKEYFYELLKDLEFCKKEHLAEIQWHIDKAKNKLHGMSYRDLDMMEHIKEVKDDERTVVVLCMPTYTAGYEKFFDTGGNLSWSEPAYSIFDAKDGPKELYGIIENANALFIIYEERKPGDYVGVPVYGRDAGRPGVRMYLASNKPELATELAEGKKIARKNPSKMTPLKCGILPQDDIIAAKSKIAVAPIKAEHATYYRRLWTHNFSGGASGSCMGLFINGKIAGVFGYDKLGIALQGGNDIGFKFGIAAPHEQRLNRLLYMVATSKLVLNLVLDDMQEGTVTGVATTMITKYPESKEMRGLMKLVKKEKAEPLGYKLIYRCGIRDESLEKILDEWVRKEEQWLKNRKKATS